MNTVEELEQKYRTAIARMEDIQRRLGGMAKDDPAREPLKGELADALAAMREAKDAIREANTRRNFAGIGSPLHEALVARFEPDVVRELEDAAVAIQSERERRGAERRAAKTSATPPSAPAAPPPPMPRPPPPVPPTLPPHVTATRRPSSRQGEVAEAFAAARRGNT